MEITKYDKIDMLNADKLYDEVMNSGVDTVDNSGFVLLPIGLYLGCNKGMILDIYKKYKAEGRLVYFVNYEGKWLLDHNGDLNLKQK